MEFVEASWFRSARERNHDASAFCVRPATRRIGPSIGLFGRILFTDRPHRCAVPPGPALVGRGGTVTKPA
jgi:hypothetical protein